MHANGTPRVGFYVSVIDGTRKGLLLGPYDTHEAALANVDRAKAEAEAVDPFAHFYAFGTSRLAGNHLPAGRLNDRLHLHPCAMCAAGIRHDRCDHDNRVRVAADFGEEPSQ